MKHFQPIKSVLVVIVISIFLTGCSKEDLSKSDGLANITIKLKRTLGQTQHVYLDIKAIQFKVSTALDVEHWVSLSTVNFGVYNMDNFSQNNPLLLIENLAVKADYVYELRLMLGDGNFISINNILHSLDVEDLGNAYPSNRIETQLKSNRHYDIVIDINIDDSIHFNEDENMMVLSPQLYTTIRQTEY
ncbi:DUF4382 domain-containing protein [uncultured Winogradskyella sp.]|uniref:DUF4382 domain-containing protein n=1 Tax=uncultured Winogradskyella sp. TaxID=395353 RepID=UPI002608ED5E|nr:DUF4382 domain-containing protein [uncultured Winogradskyella sp.]